MNQKISGPAAIVAIVVVIALIAFFSYRSITGGPNADATQANIDHFRQMAKVYAQQAHSGNAPANGGSPASAAPSGGSGAAPMAGSR